MCCIGTLAPLGKRVLTCTMPPSATPLPSSRVAPLNTFAPLAIKQPLPTVAPTT